MAADPDYRQCMRNVLFNDHRCAADPMTGRLLEWEHALTWAGRQLQEKFAIISICWWAHRGPGLDKRKNRIVAISRATDEDLEKYPNQEWLLLKKQVPA